MRVYVRRANSETNGFDELGMIGDVCAASFAEMKTACEAREDEDGDVVFDLYDGGDIVDTATVSRQMHARAAAILTAYRD
jgi:hypothetical protein